MEEEALGEQEDFSSSSWSCGICGKNDVDDNNDYVTCGTCEITVHIRCAGLGRSILNQPSFICSFCRSLSSSESSDKERRCKICPIIDNKGTTLYMKECNTVKDHVYGPQVMPNDSCNWIHAVCVNSSNVSLEGLIGIFPMRCTYCGANVGLMYVCAHKGCSNPIHMSCALMHGKIERAQGARSSSCSSSSSSSSSNSVGNLVGYCKDHSPENMGASEDQPSRDINDKEALIPFPAFRRISGDKERPFPIKFPSVETFQAIVDRSQIGEDGEFKLPPDEVLQQILHGGEADLPLPVVEHRANRKKIGRIDASIGGVDVRGLTTEEQMNAELRRSFVASSSSSSSSSSSPPPATAVDKPTGVGAALDVVEAKSPGTIGQTVRQRVQDRVTSTKDLMSAEFERSMAKDAVRSTGGRSTLTAERMEAELRRSFNSMSSSSSSAPIAVPNESTVAQMLAELRRFEEREKGKRKEFESFDPVRLNVAKKSKVYLPPGEGPIGSEWICHEIADETLKDRPQQDDVLSILEEKCCIKPPSCPVCGWTSQRRSPESHIMKDLLKHMENAEHDVSSTPDQVYAHKCDNCNLYFSSERFVKEHQQLKITRLNAVSSDSTAKSINARSPTAPDSDSDDELEEIDEIESIEDNSEPKFKYDKIATTNFLRRIKGSGEANTIELVLSKCIPSKTACPVCGKECKGNHREHAIKAMPYRHFIDKEPSEFFRFKCEDCNRYFIHKDHVTLHKKVAAGYKERQRPLSDQKNPTVSPPSLSSTAQIDEKTTKSNDDHHDLATPRLAVVEQNNGSSDVSQRELSQISTSMPSSSSILTQQVDDGTPINASNTPTESNVTTDGDMKSPVAINYNCEYLYMAIFFKSHNAWSDVDEYWKELYAGLQQVHKCLKIFCKDNTPTDTTGLWREMTTEFYFERGLDLSLVLNHDQRVKVTGKGVGLSVAATTAVGIGYLLQNKFAAVCDVPNTQLTVLLCNTDSLLHYVLIHHCGIKLDMISSTDFLLIILFDGISSIVERNNTSVKKKEAPKSCLKTSTNPSVPPSSNKIISHSSGDTRRDHYHDIEEDHDRDVDIAEANTLANKNLPRADHGAVPISNQVMIGSEMMSLMQKVLLDFKICCQSFQIGKKLMHGDVKILDKQTTRAIPVAASEEYFEISTDSRYMIRVPMLYIEEVNDAKPMLSFPPWLSSTCRSRIHTMASEVSYRSYSRGSGDYYSKDSLQKDGGTTLRHAVVSPNDNDIAALRRKIEEYRNKDELQARTSSVRNHQSNGHNILPTPTPPQQQEHPTLQYSSKLLSAIQIFEIHRRYYEAYVRKYPGSNIRIINNGVDFQVVNPDKSILFDTSEIREEGLCRLPIGYEEIDIDIMDAHSISAPKVDLIIFELVEKGTQWQLKFPDGDTLNPEKADSCLEGRLANEEIEDDLEIDIFGRSQEYASNMGHETENGHNLLLLSPPRISHFQYGRHGAFTDTHGKGSQEEGGSDHADDIDDKDDDDDDDDEVEVDIF